MMRSICQRVGPLRSNADAQESDRLDTVATRLPHHFLDLVRCGQLWASFPEHIALFYVLCRQFQGQGLRPW